MFEGGLTTAGLAAMPPGPELAAALAVIDRSRCNGYELVEVAKAAYRQIAHYQGELLAVVRESAYCPAGGKDSPAERADSPDEHAAEEIRWALTLTRRAADNMLGSAYSLIDRLPAVGEALRAGLVDLPKATVIDAETCGLPERTAREVAERILPEAPELTTGQLRARLRKLVIAIDPAAAAKRLDESVKRRYVAHGLDQDGTATLAGHHLPPDRAASAYARLDALAHAAKRAGDSRGMDEIRADLFLDILSGGDFDGGAGLGGVEVTVPLATLLRLSEQPGDLGGWGPVVAEMARKVADAQRRGRWRFSVYDDDVLAAHG